MRTVSTTKKDKKTQQQQQQQQSFQHQRKLTRQREIQILSSSAAGKSRPRGRADSHLAAAPETRQYTPE
jgi:hypothetical protein